jgi:putative colanic acid biosynthesis acetyltransferase WcaF
MMKNEILDYAISNPLGGGPSFTLKNRIIRSLWNIVWFLFASWTPPFMHRWRRLLLIIFGAKMGLPSDVRGSARVWYPPLLEMREGALLAEHVICYNQAKVVVGKGALISQGAHLCSGTHDIDDPNFQLLALPITIGNNSWVAAEAFIGPGVSVGDNAVVGARAVVFKNVGESMVFIGNPAKLLRTRNLPILDKELNRE